LRFDGFPDTLLEVSAADLWRHLPGPALFRIPGNRREPLFLSVLQHGNEDTGWGAAQAVLRRHRATPLARTLLLFVGNVQAARVNVRTLPHQNDFNRCWPGTEHPDRPTARMLDELVGIVREAAPFASIDIHNNSGHNPHYACVSSMADAHLQLARLFSRTVIYFERPLGVQSAALAALCPAVAVECGRAGEPGSVPHAVEFIESVLALQHFPGHAVPERDLDLMETRAIVRIPAAASFSCDGSDADIRLRADLDHLNFSELDPGTRFGHLGGEGTRRLEVVPARADAAAAYFEYSHGEIRLAQRVIPAMLTLDPCAVRSDCLGYLMERVRRPPP
jgi:hypothetical protein